MSETVNISLATYNRLKDCERGIAEKIKDAVIMQHWSRSGEVYYFFTETKAEKLIKVEIDQLRNEVSRLKEQKEELEKEISTPFAENEIDESSFGVEIISLSNKAIRDSKRARISSYIAIAVVIISLLITVFILTFTGN